MEVAAVSKAGLTKLLGNGADSKHLLHLYFAGRSGDFQDFTQDLVLKALQRVDLVDIFPDDGWEEVL